MKTLKIFNFFLVDGLKITDTSSIQALIFIGYPLHPVYKNGTKYTRSIIVKLNRVFDKRAILSLIKNLKNYSTTLPRKADSSIQFRRMSVIEHLLAVFINQHNQFLLAFKKSKLLEKHSSRRVVEGD